MFFFFSQRIPDLEPIEVLFPQKIHRVLPRDSPIAVEVILMMIMVVEILNSSATTTPFANPNTLYDLQPKFRLIESSIHVEMELGLRQRYYIITHSLKTTTLPNKNDNTHFKN